MPEHGPRWADIGVNLGDKQFAEDSEQVLARAADSGVSRKVRSHALAFHAVACAAWTANTLPSMDTEHVAATHDRGPPIRSPIA